MDYLLKLIETIPVAVARLLLVIGLGAGVPVLFAMNQKIDAAKAETDRTIAVLQAKMQAQTEATQAQTVATKELAGEVSGLRMLLATAAVNGPLTSHVARGKR